MESCRQVADKRFLFFSLGSLADDFCLNTFYRPNHRESLLIWNLTIDWVLYCLEYIVYIVFCCNSPKFQKMILSQPWRCQELNLRFSACVGRNGTNLEVSNTFIFLSTFLLSELGMNQENVVCHHLKLEGLV